MATADFQLQIETADPVHVQIERFFRRQIQTGALPAGQRLPSNPSLAGQWGVSPTVVQKALARLTADGLLSRKPGRGTFVRNGSDQAVIGVLFGPKLADETAHFYRSIFRSIQSEVAAHHWTFRAYDGLTELKGDDRVHRETTRRHLRNDLTNYAFKGLIEFAPDQRWPDEVEAVGDLPVARFNTAYRQTDLQFDVRRFARETVEFMVRKKRRRLTYLRSIWHASKRSEDLDGLMDTAREFNLPKPRIVEIQLTGEGEYLERAPYEKTLQLVRKWKASGGSDECPDTLLVNDDVVMRAVAMALLKAGVDVPNRLLVICQTMREVVLHYGLPVVRYEFSTREIARQLLEILWRRMTKKAPPAVPVMVRGRIKEEA